MSGKLSKYLGELLPAPNKVFNDILGIDSWSYNREIRRLNIKKKKNLLPFEMRSNEKEREKKKRLLCVCLPRLNSCDERTYIYLKGKEAHPHETNLQIATYLLQPRRHLWASSASDELDGLKLLAHAPDARITTTASTSSQRSVLSLSLPLSRYRPRPSSPAASRPVPIISFPSYLPCSPPPRSFVRKAKVVSRFACCRDAGMGACQPSATRCDGVLEIKRGTDAGPASYASASVSRQPHR